MTKRRRQEIQCITMLIGIAVMIVGGIVSFWSGYGMVAFIVGVFITVFSIDEDTPIM